MNWMVEMFSYTFMQRAIIVGVLISACAALLGVSLVLRKNSMIGDGLSHTAFSAFAVALVLGLTPIYFAIPVVIIASFVVLRLSKSRKSNGDAAIALLSASSLAIGVMAISVVKGVNIDLNSYLFGSILSVGWGDVWLSIIMTILVVGLYVFAHNRIFAIICSVVIVLGMRLLGALLISSLIIFPTIISMQFSKSFKVLVIWSVVISIINFMLGLIISYLVATPTGATVVIVNLIVLLVTKIVRKMVA